MNQKFDLANGENLYLLDSDKQKSISLNITQIRVQQGMYSAF